MPNEDDYDNINPKTYDGIFYQEQASFGDFGLEGLEDLGNVAQTRGEMVTDLKDSKMLNKLQEDDSDEPPLHELPEALYSRDSDSDEPEGEESPRVRMVTSILLW
jgi:hypothetical protein